MKRILTIIMIVVALVVISNGVLALPNTDQTPTNPYQGGSVNTQVANVTKDAWATIVVIVQIVAVACVVFAGLRYMFASADQKADIKKGLIYLSIGAILVFCATTIIKFVVDATNEIL